MRKIALLCIALIWVSYSDEDFPMFYDSGKINVKINSGDLREYCTDSRDCDYSDKNKILRLRNGARYEFKQPFDSSTNKPNADIVGGDYDYTYDFSYTTRNGTSSVYIDLGKERRTNTSVLRTDSEPATVGTGSNLTVRTGYNANGSVLKGIKLGFDDKMVRDEQELIGKNSRATFTFISRNLVGTPMSNGQIQTINMDVEINGDGGSDDVLGMMYFNVGSVYTIDTDANIKFKNKIQDTYVTITKDHYKQKNLDESLPTCEYYDISGGYNETCFRSFEIGQGFTFNLNAGKDVTNEGYIYAGLNSNVNINAENFTNNNTSSGNDNSFSKDFIINEKDNKGYLKHGGIVFSQGGNVNINSKMRNENKGAFINLGGNFNIRGSEFTNKGWLIAGQSAANTKYTGFNVSGTAKLESGTKIALATYDSSILQSDGFYLILKGEDASKIENNNNPELKILLLKKEGNSNNLATQDIKVEEL